MKRQKGKVIIELPRIPENAWLFANIYGDKPTESEKKEKKDNQEDKHSE